MGGQSAFGTKAGDVFTKITVGAALVWILLSMGALRVLHVGKFAKGPSGGGATTNTGAESKEGDTPASDTKSPTDITPPAGETPENTPAPKSDESKAESPKAEEPKAEAPKTEEPKPEAPKTDEPKPEPPKAEEPKPETPKAEEPKADEEKK
jgi:outer membrane biosynthesis protein TonB